MKIKKIISLSLVVMFAFAITSCNKSESYADRVDREREAINQYIANHNIKVITESEFYANDSTTDVNQNEYVLFASSGVYMQIVDKGKGAEIKNGERLNLLCRYTETNILTDSIQSSNNVPSYSAWVDKMFVTRNYSTFTGAFDPSSSLMYNIYQSASVPSGWLVPLAYIKVGRLVTQENALAKVNLIVPHAQGQINASQRVYPCFYTITYQRTK